MAGKIITIDWPTIAALPSDEYHIKLLNKQQAAVLNALCEYQHWSTRWDNLELTQDELDRFMGDIEFRLMGNETGGFMTVEELIEGICGGLVCAAPKIGAMLATGVTSGFTLDEDGNVVLPSDDLGEDLPEDDPATGYDDTEAARYGGTVQVMKALELLLDKIDAYYGAVNGTPVTTQPDCVDAIVLYFDCDEALMTNAILEYYAYRNTNNRILFDTTDTINLYVYCRNVSARAFNQWLIDASGYPQAKIEVVANIVAALAAGFWSEYFNQGSSKPSTKYLDAACVPIAPQTLAAMLFGVARNTTPLKANHRMKFIITGYALDVDGDIQDAFWYRTAAGVNTFTTPTFVHSAGANLPSQNQVVYNSAHRYEYTIDLQNLNAFMTITMNKHANINAVGLTYPTPFNIEIEDLGEV